MWQVFRRQIHRSPVFRAFDQDVICVAARAFRSAQAFSGKTGGISHARPLSDRRTGSLLKRILAVASAGLYEQLVILKTYKAFCRERAGARFRNGDHKSRSAASAKSRGGLLCRSKHCC
jgi:hypothetical protein